MEQNVIEISGVIVTSINDFWDAGGAACVASETAGWIRFLADLDEKKPLLVAVNSEGGDVTGAGGIAAAIRSYAEKNPVVIEIESLAASAAANLVLQCRGIPNVTVRACVASQMMFHSCMAGIFGGAGAMRDAAEGIDGYNEGIKKLLREHTTLDAAKIDSWFEEGRCGWLTAAEAKECGLVDELIGTAPAALPTVDDKATSKVAKWRRVALASYIDRRAIFSANNNKETNMADQNGEKDDEKKIVAQGDGNKDDGNKGDGNKDEGNKDDGNKDEGNKEVTLDDLQKEIDNLKERVAACEKERDEAKAAVARLTGGIKATEKGAKIACGKKWTELVAEFCKGKSGADWDAAYIKLQADYPAEFKAYCESKKNIHN